MATVDKGKRKHWSPDQTVAFLECYIERKEEFQHKRKKKFAFEKILQDLVERGILDSSTTVKILENKMQALLKAYKLGKFHSTFKRTIPYLKLICEEEPRYLESRESKDSNDSSDSVDMSDDMSVYSNEISDFKMEELSYHTVNLSGKPIKALDDGGVKAANGSGDIGNLNFHPSEAQEFVTVPPIDIKPEIRSRSASPNSPSCKPQTHEFAETAEGGVEMKSVASGIYYAEKLEVYENKLEIRARQRQQYFKKMLEDSEKRFRESEEAKMRRHEEKMEFFKRLVSK